MYTYTMQLSSLVVRKIFSNKFEYGKRVDCSNNWNAVTIGHKAVIYCNRPKYLDIATCCDMFFWHKVYGLYT